MPKCLDRIHPTPGSTPDVRALKGYRFDVPEGAWITADKAYTDYPLEDGLTGAGRTLSPWVTYLQNTTRKVMETTGSRIERLLLKHIHSVTARGFELKVGLFVLAGSLSFFLFLPLS